MIPVMINSVPVDCINRGAVLYHVPATIILSVIKREGGRNGQAVHNKNGTTDYGVLQINSIWLPKVAAYGYTKEDIQFNACKNVLVASWILSLNIAEGKKIWSGIGNYHSHTPTYNRMYRDRIKNYYQQITSTLQT